MSDILIRSDRQKVEHKMSGNVPDGHYCFWSVNGMPKRVEEGEMILFSDGESVFAKGVIIDVRDGEIRFDPLQEVDGENPIEPPSRGFKYVEEEDSIE